MCDLCNHSQPCTRLHTGRRQRRPCACQHKQKHQIWACYYYYYYYTVSNTTIADHKAKLQDDNITRPVRFLCQTGKFFRLRSGLKTGLTERTNKAPSFPCFNHQDLNSSSTRLRLHHTAYSTNFWKCMFEKFVLRAGLVVFFESIPETRHSSWQQLFAKSVIPIIY